MLRVKMSINTERRAKLPRQVDIGQIRTPYLVGSDDLQVLDQVGIATIGMLTHRRPTIVPHVDQQIFFPHHALDMLAVELPTTPTQFRPDPSRAIARIFHRYRFDRFAQVQFFSLLWLVIVRARRYLQDVTERLHPIGCCQFPYDLSPVLAREGSSRQAFFDTSNSIVSRPTMRSSSARRCSSAAALPLARGSTKTCGARSRKTSRQWHTRSAATSCSRQISANDFCL
jgi:hypothetical protein